MPFYDSIHTGCWRVSLNEQYIWKWARECNIDIQYFSALNISKLTAIVEDRLNMCTFQENINVDFIIQEEYNKLYPCRPLKKQKI